MSRVVFLHVGAPKTGTSYLQDRLLLNRDSLARHGVHYPQLPGEVDHFRPALDLLGIPWGGIQDEVDGDWDALVARIQRLSGTVIVSHEILAAARPAQVRRVLSALADSEVHVVYSARDVARQIPAEWQEGIKHQRKISFAGFLRQAQTSRRDRPTLWFWRVQSLPDVLARWSKGLPPGRVHLVTVPQAGAPRDLLWRRYCQAFGIDPRWAPAESERDNASIGGAETHLLRALNRRIRVAGLSSEDYRRLVRETVVHQTLARRTSMTKVTLPPAAHAWAVEVGQEWVAAVTASDVEVIGDLSDLRPAAPSTEQRWVNPDRPKPREVTDAALDAIVALALEAARTPESPEQITARIGRAARWLRPR